MALGAAETFYGGMVEREVDLPRGRTEIPFGKAQAGEHVLRDPVMTLVLGRAGPSPCGQARLPAVALHETHPLEDGDVRERRGWADAESRRDRLERDAAGRRLVGPDRLERVDLSPRKALEGFHDRRTT